MEAPSLMFLKLQEEQLGSESEGCAMSDFELLQLLDLRAEHGFEIKEAFGERFWMSLVTKWGLARLNQGLRDGDATPHVLRLFDTKHNIHAACGAFCDRNEPLKRAKTGNICAHSSSTLRFIADCLELLTCRFVAPPLGSSRMKWHLCALGGSTRGKTSSREKQISSLFASFAGKPRIYSFEMTRPQGACKLFWCKQYQNVSQKVFFFYSFGCSGKANKMVLKSALPCLLPWERGCDVSSESRIDGTEVVGLCHRIFFDILVGSHFGLVQAAWTVLSSWIPGRGFPRQWAQRLATQQASVTCEGAMWHTLPQV